MKKNILFFVTSLLMVIPVFSATISIVRHKPAEVDIAPAKTISFVSDAVSKDYRSDQLELAKLLINEIETYLKEDGRFTLLKEGSDKADIKILISFDSFSVSDRGITLTQKVDGKDVVIKDEWKRVISGNYSFSVIRTSDDTVVTKKNFGIFNGDSDFVPKASLKEPVEVCKYQVKPSAYSCAVSIFNTPYQEAISLQDSKTKDKALKDQMKAALKLAKSKNYAAAKDAYKQIFEETGDAAARFNYARMLQCTNEFDAAEEILKAVSTGEKDKAVKKALENLYKDRDNYNIIQSRL